MNDAPRVAPDLGGVIGSALRDLLPALKSRQNVFAGLTIIGWIGCIGLLMSGIVDAAKTNPPGQMAHPEYYAIGMPLVTLAVLIGAFYALANAVRTVRPDFRMTVPLFFGVFGYSLLVGLIVVIGCIALVIPGLYLMIKLLPAPYIYLLGEREPMKRSWNITRGRFWWTVLVLIVISACVQIGGYAIGIVGAIAYFIPFALYVLAPVLIVALFAMYQFQYNAYVRWFDELIRTA